MKKCLLAVISFAVMLCLVACGEAEKPSVEVYQTPDEANSVLREHIKDSISTGIVESVYIGACSPFEDGEYAGMLNLTIDIAVSVDSERAPAIGKTAAEIVEAIAEGLSLQKQEYKKMHLCLQFTCADNGVYNHYNYYLYNKETGKYEGNGVGTIYVEPEGAFLYAPSKGENRVYNDRFKFGFEFRKDKDLLDYLPQEESFIEEDPQVTTPGEWDELPREMCIYCGSTAVSVSGAWDCSSCGAVY